MAKEKTRIDFNAPASLVQRADVIADLLDISRTRLLIDALRDEIEERTRDETFRRHVKDAYYADNIDFQTVESILGTEDAMRLKILRQSLDRDPPVPQLTTDTLPRQDEFYAEAISEWEPDLKSDDADDDTASPR